MRCNSCWRELEGRAVSTTCGHILCADDANKILNNDAACPVCDEPLSKSLMKPLEINPNEEWINMAMVGVSPQTLMKSAYRSVMFFIGQKELEMQYKMNRVVAQCRQKCETMQEKFTEKLEQIHTAYQKMASRCQTMEREIESLSKDKQELQEKFSEKSRQKRKLEEMYDQLRNEYEMVKRPAIKPSASLYSRPNQDLFSDHHANMMDNQFTMMAGHDGDAWPARQSSPNAGPFDISGNSPRKETVQSIGVGNNRDGGRSVFTGGTGTGVSNTKSTLRSLILSPIQRPQLSRARPRPPLFTL
ncbi:unnamed protein product [Rhodiola kirilowii]